MLILNLKNLFTAEPGGLRYYTNKLLYKIIFLFIKLLTDFTRLFNVTSFFILYLEKFVIININKTTSKFYFMINCTVASTL